MSDEKKTRSTKSSEEEQDLTSLDDLAEFVHAPDSLIDDQFKRLSQNTAGDSTQKDLALELDPEDSLPELPSENEWETTRTKSRPGLSWETPEEVAEETPEEFQDEFQEKSQDELQDEALSRPLENLENLAEDFPAEEQTETEQELQMEAEENSSSDLFLTEEIPTPRPLEVPEESYDSGVREKFEEVKTFAQNFSYGKAFGGGNPPFSLILRQIKYREDAEDILELLKEFNLIPEGDEGMARKAMELGSLIVPQMSEYCAIILTHKLRAFDLDLEMGPSDQIRPPSDADANSRGRLQKKSLHQNKAAQVKLAQNPKGQRDVIISTGTQLPGFLVCSYLGVETVFSIVEEQDLEKLHFIQKTEREDLPLYEYEKGMEAPAGDSPSVRKAFLNYQKSFLHLYRDLAQQLKDKALSEGANALLGLNFQLSSIPFKEKENIKNAYHIICSATLATVAKEEGA